MVTKMGVRRLVAMVLVLGLISLTLGAKGCPWSKKKKDKHYDIVCGSSGLPDQVSSEVPADGAMDVPIDQLCSWPAASNATSYDVYFGITTTDWAPVTNTVLLTFSPPALTYSTTYYWRIDARNSVGVTPGPIWRFTTRPENYPPLMAAIGDRSIEAGQLLEFVVTADDPDGDTLTYSATSAGGGLLPPGATFDPATQTFSWKPSPGQVGDYWITFKVSDGK